MFQGCVRQSKVVDGFLEVFVSCCKVLKFSNDKLPAKLNLSLLNSFFKGY